MALFRELDTAKLVGTSSPLISRQSPAYPNPFQDLIVISTGFEQPFSGNVMAKYVIVDSFFHAIQKKSILLNIASASGCTFKIGDIPKGKYRIYVTYSTLGNEHFFKFWGNIWHN
jgi:hypothetical protein